MKWVMFLLLAGHSSFAEIDRAVTALEKFLGSADRYTTQSDNPLLMVHDVLRQRYGHNRANQISLVTHSNQMDENLAGTLQSFVAEASLINGAEFLGDDNFSTMDNRSRVKRVESILESIASTAKYAYDGTATNEEGEKIPYILILDTKKKRAYGFNLSIFKNVKLSRLSPSDQALLEISEITHYGVYCYWIPAAKCLEGVTKLKRIISDRLVSDKLFAYVLVSDRTFSARDDGRVWVDYRLSAEEMRAHLAKQE